MTHIEMVKEIIIFFIETECKTNSNTVLKRKWRKTIENVVNKNFWCNNWFWSWLFGCINFWCDCDV